MRKNKKNIFEKNISAKSKQALSRQTLSKQALSRQTLLRQALSKQALSKQTLLPLVAVILTAVLLNGCGAGSALKDEDDRSSMQTSDTAEMTRTEDTSQTDHSRESASADTASASASSGTGSSAPAVAEAAQTGEMVPVVYGDERVDLYLPLLEGKRTAVFSNQTGIVGNRIIESGAEEARAGNTEEKTVSKSDSNVAAESSAEADISKSAEDAAEADAAESAKGAEADVTQSAKGAEADVTESAEGTAPAEGLVPFGLNPDGTPVEYGEHIVDAMLRQGVDVTVAFSPEHGFRGTEDAGAQVGDYVDEKTGVPVVSLYGGGSMYPSDEDMSRFDTLVIDIQDVGLRYYTYYISMYYLMDACAAAGKEVVILDRPNPNGYYVDGPVLQDEFTSGVGILPIPVVHGMTLGELAQMINGEGWLGTGKDSCSLTVVPCDHYSHATLTSLVTRPSPNLKDMRAIYLYASTCFFENTACSVGRGTDYPFEIFGSPYLEGADGCSFSFIPESMEGAHSPVFEGQICYGRDLREIPLSQILEEQINLNYVIEAYRAMQSSSPGTSFFGSADGYGRYWIDYLSGTDRVRRMIEEGAGAEEIRASWQSDVDTFKEQRRPYLIYN